MNKGEKWLARAMLPMVVSGLALGWLAVRPCEPVAQANTEQTVLQMPEQTIYGETVPEVDVESLPKVSTQGSRKGVAHTSVKKPCHLTTLYPDTNGWRDLDSSEGGRVQAWYCQ